MKKSKPRAMPHDKPQAMPHDKPRAMPHDKPRAGIEVRPHKADGLQSLRKSPIGAGGELPYLSSSSSMACISLKAWLLPVRAAQAIPAFSRSAASALRPAPAKVCADMK